jgi:hypothetical protein
MGNYVGEMAKKAPKFSFKKAVTEARRDFPEETRDIQFIDLSTPGAEAELEQWMKTQPQWYRRQVLGEGGTAGDQLDRMRFDVGFLCLPGASGKHLLAFAPDFTHYRQHFSLQFIFDHELGHLVAKGGSPGKDREKEEPQKPRRIKLAEVAEIYAAIARMENVADSFAVLRGLSRGTLGRDEINDVALTRAYSAWRRRDFSHMTLAAVDALLVHDDGESLASLAPQQVKDLATLHGESHAPSAADILRAYKALRSSSRVSEEGEETIAGQVLGLADIVSKQEPGSLAFHIAARVLSQAFRSGIVEYAGPLGDFRREEGWQPVANYLKTRSNGRFESLLGDFDENSAEIFAPLKSPAAPFNALKIKTPRV